MATKIRPLHDRVIVKRIAEEEKTKGGIIIPDTAKEKPQEGKVIAVGPGKYEDGKLVPLGVKAGDKILFGLGFIMMRTATVPSIAAQSAMVSATLGSFGSTGLTSPNRPG